MIKRDAEDALKRLADQFPVVAVTGPRQSGKTTLAKSVFPEKKYVSLDDKNMREIARSNPADFLKAFPEGAIIDEAQKVPEIFEAIKLTVDNEKYIPGKYILTGSSQFRLKENITDSLAGRIGMIKLMPLSIEELKNDGSLTEDPYDYVFKGFYPPLYDRNKRFVREDWFENYIDTYVDLDVKDQINPSNVNSFRRLVQVLATLSGQMVNYDALSRDIGVSATTIKAWLSILESSFIIHFLDPDSNNLGKSVVKTPKLYFVDPGLMCYLLRLESKEELLLDNHKGAAVETMAVAELLKKRLNAGRKSNLTYFRDKNGFEVDVIADWKHTFAIEVKSNASSESKLSSNVRKYIELRHDKPEGVVFYMGDISFDVNGIKYVSWKDWGKIRMHEA